MWRLAVVWGILFTMSALGTSITASLLHVKWSTLDGQDKLIMCIAIFGNWSTVVMALITKVTARLGSPEPPSPSTLITNGPVPVSPDTDKPGLQPPSR